MIDVVKYNKERSNFHAFCRMLDYVKENYPHLLRNEYGNLRSPKEYRNFFDRKLNAKIKNQNSYTVSSNIKSK
jgi:hypothetical protein